MEKERERKNMDDKGSKMLSSSNMGIKKHD